MIGMPLTCEEMHNTTGVLRARSRQNGFARLVGRHLVDRRTVPALGG